MAKPPTKRCRVDSQAYWVQRLMQLVTFAEARVRPLRHKPSNAHLECSDM
jgi:hypothetical protein